MKTLKTISFVVLASCLLINFTSCENASKDAKKKDAKTKMVTQEFNAAFVGTYMYFGPDTLPDQKCIDTIFDWRVKVDCKGSVNVMGDVKVHFDFCGDNQGNYSNTYAYMVDKSNDTLFMTGSGIVIDGKTEAHPSYVISYWKDDFEILGGTGKYEDAYGSGKMDDYNSSEDPNSHHFWKGMITMKKEK